MDEGTGLALVPGPARQCARCKPPTWLRSFAIPENSKRMLALSALGVLIGFVPGEEVGKLVPRGLFG